MTQKPDWSLTVNAPTSGALDYQSRSSCYELRKWKDSMRTLQTLITYPLNTSLAVLGKPLQCRRPGFDPCVGKIPWRRTCGNLFQYSFHFSLFPPVFSPGKFHGERTLMGYSPWGCKESDTTERLTLSFSLYTFTLLFHLIESESSAAQKVTSVLESLGESFPVGGVEPGELCHHPNQFSLLSPATPDWQRQIFSLNSFSIKVLNDA